MGFIYCWKMPQKMKKNPNSFHFRISKTQGLSIILML